MVWKLRKNSDSENQKSPKEIRCHTCKYIFVFKEFYSKPMSIEIYYFSGTGNSLFIARELANKLQGKLIPIASLIKQERINSESEIIGVVFPVYLAHLNGIPLIVKDFIQKLAQLDSKYLFAVCTCGGYEIVNALPTLS